MPLNNKVAAESVQNQYCFAYVLGIRLDLAGSVKSVYYIRGEVSVIWASKERRGKRD